MKVDVDKHQRDSEYDRRRVRTFQNSWKTGRPWLIFNKPKNVMTCSFCTDLAATRKENNSTLVLLLLDVIISGLKLYVLMKRSIFIKDLIESMMPKVPSLAQLLLKRSCKTLIQLKSIK
jgi:hypothetical protein